MGKTRFVIEVEGKHRNLFSIREVPNSDDSSILDLNIHFSSGGRIYFGETFDELITPPDENLFTLSDVHISVHCSLKSDAVNMIKRTVNLPDNNELSSVLITNGIKRDQLFVPIFFRVCGNPNSERFDLPENCEDELVELGQFNPTRDQLRFMVVVAGKRKRFPFDVKHPSNNRQVSFSEFEVIVIWSYFNRPSYQHSINIFHFSTNETGPVRGYEWQEVYDMYTNHYMAYAERYFATHEKE